MKTQNAKAKTGALAPATKSTRFLVSVPITRLQWKIVGDLQKLIPTMPEPLRELLPEAEEIRAVCTCEETAWSYELQIITPTAAAAAVMASVSGFAGEGWEGAATMAVEETFTFLRRRAS